MSIDPGSRRGDDREELALRQNVHRLLAENPNYFGNLPELGIPPVVQFASNTVFEQLTCVGLNPDLDVLEATVQQKRSAGYGGSLCEPGSTEWVRFYLSYDDGATWEDVGLASYNAHDIPEDADCAKQSTKPLAYTVAHPLPEVHRQRCSRPVLPLVRAILSWQVQPPAAAPNWPPIWGNVLDRHVQLRPRTLFLHDFVDIVKATSLPKVFEPLLATPLPEPGPAPLVLADALALAKEGDVPVHRAVAPLLAEVVGAPTIAQSSIVEHGAAFAAAGLDFAKTVAEYLDGAGNTTYEELGCLGLDYNRDLFVGTFRVKLPSGFSGPLCGPGSVEYVAFWVDYDDTCEWTYAGTAQVRVHDISPLPKDGLHYWVAVPGRTREHARSCKEPKVAKLRAVLSWATPPSTTNPHQLPVWGNAIETHIEIRPRTAGHDDAAIDIIGGIPIGQIDTASTGTTLPFAQFAEWGSPADPWVSSRQCPFGGTVTANADAPASFAAAGRKYRLLWRPAGTSGSGTPVTDPYVTSNGIVVTTRTPDPGTGLTPYLDPSQNVFNVLGSWRTRGVVVDGTYEIRLEMTDAGGTPIGGTPWYAVHIDNTPPHADITLTGGAPCNKATPGDTVSGTFTATDTYFGAYALDTLPASLNPPAPSHTPVSTTASVPSGTWQLVTDGTWSQCGYVVRLQVWDRAIVDSVPWGHNYGYDDTGFCLGL